MEPATCKLFRFVSNRTSTTTRTPYLSISLTSRKYTPCERDDSYSHIVVVLSQDKIYSDVNSFRALVRVKRNVDFFFQVFSRTFSVHVECLNHFWTSILDTGHIFKDTQIQTYLFSEALFVNITTLLKILWCLQTNSKELDGRGHLYP